MFYIILVSSLICISFGIYFVIKNIGIKEERQRITNDSLDSVAKASKINRKSKAKKIDQIKKEMDNNFTRDL